MHYSDPIIIVHYGTVYILMWLIVFVCICVVCVHYRHEDTHSTMQFIYNIYMCVMDHYDVIIFI